MAVGCPSCGHVVSTRASSCPNCGEPFGNSYSSSRPCPLCGGRTTDPTTFLRCRNCAGTGRVRSEPEMDRKECRACWGSGGHWYTTTADDPEYRSCHGCGGSGTVPKNAVLCPACNGKAHRDEKCGLIFKQTLTVDCTRCNGRGYVQ